MDSPLVQGFYAQRRGVEHPDPVHTPQSRGRMQLGPSRPGVGPEIKVGTPPRRGKDREASAKCWRSKALSSTSLPPGISEGWEWRVGSGAWQEAGRDLEP